MKIAASVLAFDFSRLNDTFKEVNEHVDWIHYDVMDGHFVPNISFGPDILKDLKKMTSHFIDVHLMIEEPMKYLDRFIEAGADLITIHHEAVDQKSCQEIITHLKERNIKVGISVKPNTDPLEIAKYLPEIDLVLVMSVEPGFGGQQFLASAYDKIVYYDEFRREYGLDYLIEVDGGVNDKNASSIIECGADVLVTGSYLIKGDIKENVAKLKV